MPKRDRYDQLAELYGALAHPLRLRILAALAASDEPLSPKRLAQALDEKLGDVAYHFRPLKRHGLIKLRGTVQRRGALEHLYELAPQGRALLAHAEAFEV